MATPYILAPHCFCCSIALGRSGRLRHLRPGWFSRWLRLLRSEPECGCSCSAGSGFRLTRFYRVHLTLLQTHTKNTTRLTIFLFKKKQQKKRFWCYDWTRSRYYTQRWTSPVLRDLPFVETNHLPDATLLPERVRTRVKVVPTFTGIAAHQPTSYR